MGIPFLDYSLLVFEVCAGVLEAEALISRYILLEKAMNMKMMELYIDELRFF